MSGLARVASGGSQGQHGTGMQHDTPRVRVRDYVFHHVCHVSCQCHCDMLDVLLLFVHEPRALWRGPTRGGPEVTYLRHTRSTEGNQHLSARTQAKRPAFATCAHSKLSPEPKLTKDKVAAPGETLRETHTSKESTRVTRGEAHTHAWRVGHQ